MAYTKYSLTPSSNTAAPPDGAPEGMLPSAVNDTMRDMMAQIRDCGDGIRDGTYTMTAPKITGGTITGSTINNSAIGGTTAAAGKFTTLEATGVATFSAGAVGTPAITTTGDTNTGIFFPAADTIAFTEGGVEAMRIDSSGNVGIGTSSPNAKLDVFVSSGTNLALTKTGGAYLSFYEGTTLRATVNGLSSADGLAFTTGSAATERMRIDSSGNVGIGTSSPRAKLNIEGGSTTSINATACWQYIGSGAAASYTSSNYMGIGFGYNNADNAEAPAFIGFTVTNPTASTNGALVFATRSVTSATAPTERMRITSGGSVGIGTTSPASRLDVVGGAASVTASGAAVNILNLKDSVDQSGATYIQFLNSTGGNIGNVNRVTTTNAVVYNTTSDYRLKTVTGDVTGQGSRIDALKPIDYQWKEGNQQARGFLAHEFQTVYPNSVSGEKDAIDKDGNPKYQSMQASSSEVMADLIAEIQSLRKRVAQLESK